MDNILVRFCVGFLLVTVTSTASAAEVQVFGPQKVVSSSKATSYNFSANAPNGTLKLVNGDGTDLSPANCKGLALLPKLQCEISNVAKLLVVALDRPTVVDIKVNDVVVVSKSNYKPELGQINLSIPLKSANNIQVKVSGLPWANVTVGVAAAGAVNQLPVPAFSMTPASGIAPETIVFNGVMSADPDGTIQDYEWDFGDGGFSAGSIVSHIYQIGGNYQVKLTVTDNQGGKAFITKSLAIAANVNPVADFTFTLDGLNVSFNASASSDADGSISSYVWDYGDGQSGSGVQSAHAYTSAGTYSVKLTVKDNKGGSAAVSKSVALTMVSPPVARLVIRGASQGAAPLMAFFDASTSTDPNQLALSYSWDFGDGSTIAAGDKVTHEYKNVGSYTVRVTVTNSNNQSGFKEATIQVINPVLPPAPATIAPALADNQVTPMGESVQFLFKGDNPIQKDVTVDQMEVSRLAVISGMVYDQDGNALSGVKVKILDGGIYGYTLSREDGRYDLAVNGNGEFTVHFERNGFLSSQRKIDTKALNYSATPDVYLVARDPKVTKVDLNKSAYQVAQGSLMTDSSGSRTATIVIPSNTTAKLILPSGAEVAVNSLSLRATEYTVGANGPKRMPAELPKTSGYTYAVDLSADEGVAIGAEHIKFNQLVPVYVENFLNFPVGTAVPFGIYSFKRGLWEPQRNGIVLKVVAITNGSAVVSADIAGAAASAAVLQNLGLTADELTQIASLYQVGQSFSRYQTDHFSPGDGNYVKENGLSIIADGETARSAMPVVPGVCPMRGSIVDPASQTLGEVIPLQGLDVALTYSTSRVEGRSAERSIWVPISSTPLGGTVKYEIAGRTFTESLSTSSQIRRFTWDGYDAYGRKVDGSVPAKVHITYNYPANYRVPSSSGGIGFIASDFGRFGGGLSSSVPAREPWQANATQSLLVGTKLAYSGLGGWGISGHHFYDTANKVLYYSNGQKVSISPEAGQDFNSLIRTYTGSVDAGYEGDGGNYKSAKFSKPASLLATEDGSLYIIDSGNYRIRRIAKDGTISTIAGTGTAGYNGDGGAAINSQINVTENSVIIAGPNNSLIFSDTNNNRIRQIDADGIMTTIAGNGTSGSSGDNADAKLANLAAPEGVAYYEGQVYIADTQNDRIRAIDPNGVIYTVIANSSSGSVVKPRGVSFGTDGKLYMALPTMNVVSVITSSGQYNDFGSRTFVGDSASFTYSRLPFRGPSQVYVAKDGREFVLNRDYKQIWVSRSRTIKNYAGGGTAGENIYPHRDSLDDVNSMAFDKLGRVFITNGNVIKIIEPMLPAVSSTGNIEISSESGDEIYVFNNKGQHVKTLSGLTGVVLKTFTYDAKGLLVSIGDRDQMQTTIERDSSGKALSITGPFGQRINLLMNGQGYLSKVMGPGGLAYQLNYGTGGLLSEFIQPNGATSTFAYDDVGQLTQDTNHLGGFIKLVKTMNAGGAVVRVSTPLIPDRTHEISFGSYGESYTRNTASTGLIQTVKKFESTWAESNPWQVNLFRYELPDQRLGGLTKYMWFDQDIFNSSSMTRSYPVLTQDKFTYQRLDQISYLGTSSEVLFDSAAKSITETSGRGVVSVAKLDSKDRLVSVVEGDLLPLGYSYNTLGQLTQVSQGGRVANIAYNDKGLISSSQAPDGKTVSYLYDTNDRLILQTFSDNRQVSYDYDQNGNLTKIVPSGKPAHIFGRNILGYITEYLPPSLGGGATSTVYEYDSEKRVSKITRPDGKVINYIYGAKGRLSAISTAEGNYQYTYSTVQDLVLGSVSPDGVSIANQGGLFDQQITQTGPIATQYRLAYTMLPSGMLPSYMVMPNDGTKYVSTEFDRAGMIARLGGYNSGFYITRSQTNNLIKKVEMGSYILDYDYNNMGELLSSSFHRVNENSIFDFSLVRDSIGRVSEKTENINQVSKNYKYSYDDTGRLTEVFKDGVLSGRYSYDSNGNRVLATVGGVSKNATYDDQDRLLSYGSKTYSYNLNGELTAIQDNASNSTKSFTYNSFGSLKTASANGKNIEYVLDAYNRRVGKRVGGALTQGFIYQTQTEISAELDGNNQIVSLFAYGHKRHVPAYFVKGADSTWYSIISDSIGSVRLVVEMSTGNVVQEMDYDEFGNVTKDTNPGFQPFGFAGGLYDRDTGLVHFGTRDYDPEIGRWTSKDPIGFAGGDTNLYGYIAQDPVNWVDPSGLAKCTFSGGVLSCTSNDGKTTIAVNAFTNSGPQNMTNGAIPAGTYDITKLPDSQYGTWFLDPGVISRGLYKIGLGRGGFNLHIPGNASNGCITARRANNNAGDIYNLNQLLTNEMGSNTLVVPSNGN